MASSLRNVKTFGWMDAADDCEYLNDCFEAHATFRRILTNAPMLVLGRKGTGKTAICEKLQSIVSPKVFTERLTFTNYDWGAHAQQGAGLPPEQSWRYLILVTFATMVLRDQSTIIAGESYRRLESFVIDTYGSLDVAFQEAFLPERRLRLKSLEVSIGAGVKAGTKAEWDDLPMDRLPSIINHLNKTLENLILKCCNAAHTYYILFDELDRDFRRGDLEYQRRLEALLNAGVGLLRAGRDAHKRLNIVIFLRSDIYDEEVLLPGGKNKITQNFTETLDWSETRFQEGLKSLMEKRLRLALNDKSVTWESVFDVRRVGHPPRSSFQFILDHTMCRPRDLIQFANYVLDAFQERTCNLDGDDHFSEIDILNACYRYGEYLYGEITDEAAERSPDLRLYFQMLKSLNLEKFYRQEFMDAYAQLEKSLTVPLSGEAVLNRLFDLSVIGCRRPTPHRYIPDCYCFKYFEVNAKFDPSAEAFTVHEGLRPFLGRYVPRDNLSS